MCLCRLYATRTAQDPVTDRNELASLLSNLGGQDNVYWLAAVCGAANGSGCSGERNVAYCAVLPEGQRRWVYDAAKSGVWAYDVLKEALSITGPPGRPKP